MQILLTICIVKYSCKFQSEISALFIVQVNMSVERTSCCAVIHSQLLGKVESLITRVCSVKTQSKYWVLGCLEFGFVFVLSLQLTEMQCMWFALTLLPDKPLGFSLTWSSV